MVNPLSYVKTQGQPQSVGIQAKSSICCRMLSVSTENDFLLGATSGCVCENCRFVRGLCSGTLISFQMWELASLPPSSSASSLRRSIVPTSKDVLLRFYLRRRRWAPSAHQRLPVQRQASPRPLPSEHSGVVFQGPVQGATPVSSPKGSVRYYSLSPLFINKPCDTYSCFNFALKRCFLNIYKKHVSQKRRKLEKISLFQQRKGFKSRH